MLKIRLLGPIQVVKDGQLLRWRSRKAPALLAYLATTQAVQQREHLADLLWSNTSPSLSASNLRTILSMLRKALGDRIVITRYTVELVVDESVEIDLHQLAECIDSAEITPLKTALLATQGDFLSGFYLKNARRFEEWALIERERQRRIHIDGHRTLYEQLAALGNWPDAEAVAQNWAQTDVLDESGWRALMAAMAAQGNYAGAEKTYDDCAAALNAELSVQPNSLTLELYQSIKDREYEPQPPTAQKAANNLPEQFTPFVGRSAEIQQLRSIIQNQACHLLTIHGVGAPELKNGEEDAFTSLFERRLDEG